MNPAQGVIAENDIVIGSIAACLHLDEKARRCRIKVYGHFGEILRALFTLDCYTTSILCPHLFQHYVSLCSLPEQKLVPGQDQAGHI